MSRGYLRNCPTTPSGRIPREDEIKIRSQVILCGIPYTTTIFGALATADGIDVLRKKKLRVKALQEYYKDYAGTARG